jgi:Zn-dependent M16 (insulinase) family peptidase
MSQEEEIYLKYESLIEEHDLDESQFSERLQQKIQQIEDLCDAFEDCEEEEEDEILLKIQAMDDGICADLDSVIAKMKDDEEDEEPKDNKMSDGGQTNTNSDAPSWRFWM